MASFIIIKHPTTIIVSGPTQCGKTFFVVKLIKSDLIQPPPERVWWIYGFWQPIYEELEGTKFIHASGAESAPAIEKVFSELKPSERKLLVLDDQMGGLADSKELSRLFTEGSHHLNLTIIYIVQNLFNKGKSQRTASINTHYFVLFKNPRDTSQVSYLMQQLARSKARSLVKIFEDARLEATHTYI